MSSFLTDPFSINGVISTDKTVISNINDLATAAGAWMTYDISQGKYAVVINTTGSSIASFDDSNIIGGINVSGTGINELYNKVSIEFPHKDLNDERDYIDLEIPSADRLPNELDNKLSIYTDLINDPVQAQFIASVELKQTRLDKIIEFRTDYSKIGLKAGDLIDVTNDTYGYTNKMFRIIKIQEDDGDVLAISITALEYDADIYDDTGLERRFRDRRTGIIPSSINTAVVASENAAVTTQSVAGTADYVTPTKIASGDIDDYLLAITDAITAGIQIENDGLKLPAQAIEYLEISRATVASLFTAYSGNLNWVDNSTPLSSLNQNAGGGPALAFNIVGVPVCALAEFEIGCPQATMDIIYPEIYAQLGNYTGIGQYVIDFLPGTQVADSVIGFIPLEINLYKYVAGVGSGLILYSTYYTNYDTPSVKVLISNLSFTIEGDYYVTIEPSPGEQFGTLAGQSYHTNYSIPLARNSLWYKLTATQGLE